ncbi:hypothetical protein, partial [Enterococcus hirae]|uniref:hypothetical protein n=1 Tax=Enterococcus hirae TaxID=1354 RepID=UPI00136E3578
VYPTATALAAARYAENHARRVALQENLYPSPFSPLRELGLSPDQLLLPTLTIADRYGRKGTGAVPEIGTGERAAVVYLATALVHADAGWVLKATITSSPHDTEEAIRRRWQVLATAFHRELTTVLSDLTDDGYTQLPRVEDLLDRVRFTSRQRVPAGVSTFAFVSPEPGTGPAYTGRRAYEDSTRPAPGQRTRIAKVPFPLWAAELGREGQEVLAAAVHQWAGTVATWLSEPDASVYAVPALHLIVSLAQRSREAVDAQVEQLRGLLPQYALQVLRARAEHTPELASHLPALEILLDDPTSDLTSVIASTRQGMRAGQVAVDVVYPTDTALAAAGYAQERAERVARGENPYPSPFTLLGQLGLSPN